MGWKPPNLYQYFAKGINALTKEIEFIGWEECVDFEVFQDLQICVIAIRNEETFSNLFTLDLNEFETTKTRVKIPVNEEAIRFLRKQAGNLYVKTGDQEVSIYGNINLKLQCRVVRIKQIPGSYLQDFVPCGMNRLTTLSLDGKLVLYEFSLLDSNFGSIGNCHQIKLQNGEICSTLSSCIKARFITVTTKRLQSGRSVISRLFLYEVEKNGEFKLLSIFDFKNLDNCQEEGSFFTSVSLDYYHGEYPLIIGNQRIGDNLIFVLVFNGAEIVEYSEQHKVYTSTSSPFSYYNKELYSVDENGNISKISFN